MPRSTNRVIRQKEFIALENQFYEGVLAHYGLSDSECILGSTLEQERSGNQQYKKTNHLEFLEITSVAAGLLESKYKPLVLIFSSAKNPGGGVLNGAVAQEEDISLCSTWYFQAKESKGFYLEGHVSPVYTDNLLYVEKSLIVKDDNHYWLSEPKQVSFVASTAPNYTAIGSQSLPISDTEIQRILHKRALNVLNLASIKGHGSVVLGAWGTGVFGLPGQLVANAFKAAIDESHFAGRIVFAIPDSQMLTLFKRTIGIAENNVSARNAKPSAIR